MYIYRIMILKFHFTTLRVLRFRINLSPHFDYFFLISLDFGTYFRYYPIDFFIRF